MSRLPILIHGRTKMEAWVHRTTFIEGWGRREKQNKICMHRSVPEYKQRIIMDHKVTVSWCVAWVGEAWGMEVGRLGGSMMKLCSRSPWHLQVLSLFCWHLRYDRVPSAHPHIHPVVTSFSLFAAACLLYHNGTRISLRCYYAVPTNGQQQVGKLIRGIVFHQPLWD
jgi:hypothetical protein